MISRLAKSLHSYNPIPTGCIRYYPFWALKGSVVRSEDLYRGVCTWTGATDGVGGKVFDGTDDIGVLDSNVTKGLTGITMLLRLNATDDSKTQYLLGDSSGGVDLSVVYYLADQAGTGTYSMRTLLNGEDSAETELAGTSTIISYGVDHLLGFTWDLADIINYLDGVADGTKAYVDTSLEQTVTFNTAIGNYRPDTTGTEEFKGTMKELWIYDRALSVGEVSHIYHETKGR